MRNFYAILTAAALLSDSAMAAGTDASPPRGGKPAGLRPAQEADNTIFYIVGLGAVAAGVALIASDSGNNNPPTTTPSTQ